MPIVDFEPGVFFNEFGGHEPALTIRPGDTVRTCTADAHGFDAEGREVARRGNPLTGPFYIEGAKPGDAISVRLDELGPNRPACWSRSALAPNVVDPEHAASLPERGYLNWVIEPFEGKGGFGRGRHGMRVKLAEGQSRFPPPSFPLSPMLGCIGVAPPEGQVISSLTSGRHGGNMDWRGAREGVTFYFPVFTDGAMLSIGDGHACQGDGELLGTGAEVSFDVRFTVDVVGGMNAGWPRGEDAASIFTMGNARPLDQALQHATTEMLRWLAEGWSVGTVEACLLLGFGAAYEVANVFDPAYTVVCRLRKELVPKRVDPLP